MMLTGNALEKAIQEALQVSEVHEDALRCPISVTWQMTDEPNAHPIVVLMGVEGCAAVTLTASTAVWTKVFSPEPAPGYQSLGALRRQCPEFSIEGTPDAIAQALPFIERLIETCRLKHNKLQPEVTWNKTVLAHITGKYYPIDSEKTEWVYAEQSGNETSPALLLLHTAGADARQWHGLMGQEKLRQQWRMHAFDLPGHGRSPLPNGTANWNWRLTESNYTKWILSYMDAAGIEKTTLMGCSMGTAISLALLAEHPDRFYGAVLLEAPYCSPGRRSIYLNHSQVHGARLSAAWVGSLLSPTSGKAHRDQATWIYSQGAPGIYDGDLGYYSDDFNANHHTGAIDTQRTPVWLFTGDYDYSATPTDSAKVASEIKGAHFQELKGFGHFPMVERPDDLTLHLLPALAAIKAHIQSYLKESS
jgi:pimeloyl-ACP methyl ester carboxylesterase